MCDEYPGDSVGNNKISRSPPSYRTVADHMSAMEAYVVQYFLPEFAINIRTAKLSLLLISAGQIGEGGRQAGIRDFTSA